ncbi:50S ribosomal protein L5 [Fervidibacter sacchari]|uniref:50S ribosomal protein L5 n=1 Tax=Candidatus Fervidibacter sacchari TaxID=1448929 RepID=UPI0004782152|nr:50S ribosomal protein L5 [Candidatus Fervidibacter sacchari]WKU18006.1 50S ribosomal protein L5 [Candidatus Fervidibacter sacchari]
MPRLKERYLKEVVPKLMERFGYKNVMQVPRITKVVINVGVGEGKEDARAIDSAIKELSLITGQRPVVKRAKRAIAGFRLRKGQPIAVTVTLRRDRMWDFLDRLINAALPRIRDFKGLSPDAFDGHGNYNLGIPEQLIFPELTYDDIYKVRGMNITIVTTAETDEEAAALLKELGFPLRDESQ